MCVSISPVGLSQASAATRCVAAEPKHKPMGLLLSCSFPCTDSYVRQNSAFECPHPDHHGFLLPSLDGFPIVFPWWCCECHQKSDTEMVSTSSSLLKTRKRSSMAADWLIVVMMTTTVAAMTVVETFLKQKKNLFLYPVG